MNYIISKKDMTYFKIAKAVSLLSDHKHFKIGALIVFKHRIISSGYNSQTKTDPIQAKLDFIRYGCVCPGKLHAESSALIPLIKSGVNLNGASIYVYREHKNGNLANAKPCPSCSKLIREAGIKKVFYTVENGCAVEKI